MVLPTQPGLSRELDELIVRMPKVELHLHLEGTIQPATLLALAQRNNVEIPARDEAGVAQLFNYYNFHEFLTVFMALAQALRNGRDFEEVAYQLGAYLYDQRILYAEVMISPAQYFRRGMDLVEIVQGAAAGFARARRDYGVHAALVFDYGRQFGVELGWRILDQAIQAMPFGLIGWSIGGDELNGPPEQYGELFAAARKAGLRTMAHAGEVVGPASVWGAVDALAVERLGHGIRSIDDPELLKHLRNRNVVLDVCPTSNVRTGAVAGLEVHPLRRLYDAGVRVTINSDDPVFFATSMIDEYRLAARTFRFSADDLVAVTLDAVRATFLPADEQAALLQAFEQEIQALRAEIGA